MERCWQPRPAPGSAVGAQAGGSTPPQDHRRQSPDRTQAPAGAEGASARAFLEECDGGTPWERKGFLEQPLHVAWPFGVHIKPEWLCAHQAQPGKSPGARPWLMSHRNALCPHHDLLLCSTRSQCDTDPQPPRRVRNYAE
jgi:hypothetical protein